MEKQVLRGEGQGASGAAAKIGTIAKSAPSMQLTRV
jgi:hypothetical protein